MNNEITYRPRLAFYHPNGKGTGGAAKLELVPAHGDSDGCIFMLMANQCAVGGQGGSASPYARFDWEGGIPVKLGFDDLCRMLQVMRGVCESVGEGKGLYHRTASGATRIVFRHLIEPTEAYMLELYNTQVKGTERRARIVLNPAEVMGLCESISGAMSVIAFGIPQATVRGGDVKPTMPKGSVDV